MITYTYTYLFICERMDHYEKQIREAKTKEMRDFCIEQFVFYKLKHDEYFN